MKKKVLICSIIAAVAALSAAAFAGCDLSGKKRDEPTVYKDNMRFTLNEDGTYELDTYLYAYLKDSEDGPAYTGEGETVTVPATVNGKAVTSIDWYAFRDRGVKEVILPDAITVLPNGVFDGCSLLERVVMPSVTVVGRSAFEDCTGLKEIEFQSGLTALEESAFEGCSSLSTVVLPDTTVSLGERCFYQSGLENLKADGVQAIAYNAFYGCEKLTALNLPSVVSIEEYAFDRCYNLKEMSIGKHLQQNKSGFKFLSKVSINSPVPDNAFGGALTEATLGEGVTSIGANAFKNSQISELTLPSSLKSVGTNAFDGCERLNKIEFSEGLETLGADAFYDAGTPALEIILPSTVKTLGARCFSYVRAKKLVINETVEKVGVNSLYNCNVEELIAPVSYGQMAAKVGTLTLFGEGDIPAYAYKNCDNLKTVNLSAGIKSIGSNAFSGLEKINLNGVEFLGNNALGNLSALTYTKTENGVNYIDNWIISTDYSQGGPTQLDLSGLTGVYEHAFKKTDTNDTSTLTTVFLTDSDGASTLKQIGESAFEGSGITGVEIPASLNSWNYAFSGCKMLNAVAVNKGVDKIPNGAFNYCNGLSGFNFANTDITEIGEYAFNGCSALSLITLPNSIKKIGNCAFRNCTSLLSADIKGTEEIGYNSFLGCSSLGEVTMNSVKTIGDLAFYGCRNLTEIDLTASVTKLDDGALGHAETVNFAGTADEWSAIDKYMENGKIDIWSPLINGGVYRDLTVTFVDGSSVIYSKNESQG